MGRNSNSTIKEMPSQELQGSALIEPRFVTWCLMGEGDWRAARLSDGEASLLGAGGVGDGAGMPFQERVGASTEYHEYGQDQQVTHCMRYHQNHFSSITAASIHKQASTEASTIESKIPDPARLLAKSPGRPHAATPATPALLPAAAEERAHHGHRFDPHSRF